MWLEERGKEIVEIPPDGLCFLRALQHCLAVQHSEQYSITDIQSKIISEIVSNTQFYMAFHTATTQEQLIQQVQEYFEKRIFASDIVDVVIGLCCNVFSITLWIFQENKAGNLETISYNTNEEKNSRRHVHVALYCDRGDVDGLASHYNAVVSKNKNKGQIYIHLQSQEVSGSGPPSPFDVPTPVPSPSYGKDDFDPTYEDTELLPDFSSEPDASMYNLSTPQQRVLFPLELFEDMGTMSK